MSKGNKTGNGMNSPLPGGTTFWERHWFRQLGELEGVSQRWRMLHKISETSFSKERKVALQLQDMTAWAKLRTQPD